MKKLLLSFVMIGSLCCAGDHVSSAQMELYRQVVSNSNVTATDFTDCMIAGANLSQKDPFFNKSPLELAAINGNVNAINCICNVADTMRSVGGPRHINKTKALHEAVLHGRDNSPSVQLLISRGAKVSEKMISDAIRLNKKNTELYLRRNIQ